MNSTFRLLLAAMPDIARACEQINDPSLRDRAFDTLVQAARDGGYDPAATLGGVAPDTTYAGFAASATLPASSYDPTSTRVDNGLRG